MSTKIDIDLPPSAYEAFKSLSRRTGLSIDVLVVRALQDGLTLEACQQAGWKVEARPFQPRKPLPPSIQSK